MGPSGDPGERLRAIRLAELDHWSRTNPYGMIQGIDVRFLIDRIAVLERERDALQEVADASLALHAEDGEPDGRVFTDAYVRWVKAVEELAYVIVGAALRAGG